jgi:hypothetical protein
MLSLSDTICTRMSSRIHDAKMVYLARSEGGPMYTFTSALTNGNHDSRQG